MIDEEHQQFADIVSEEQRKKARNMQLAINRYNRSRDDDHSRDEQLDNLENEDDNT